MKKIILSILSITIPLILSAQTSPVEGIFDKYSGKDGYTSVYITKYMFELFAKIANEKEDKEFKEITSKLNGIKILTIDSIMNLKRGHDFYKEIVSSLPIKDYKDLMIIKEGSGEIKFMIREDASKISELIMVMGGSEAVLIVLQGDIDLKQVSKLSKSMDIKGLEHLDKVDNKKK